jgi:Na+-transporting methylmalonyl-CoA/oxaloacetate decarboxylase beta subunit
MKHRRFSILVIIITAICAGALQIAIALKAALPLILLRLGASARGMNAVGIIGGADGPTSIYLSGAGAVSYSAFTAIMALLAAAGTAYLIVNGRK